MQKAQDIINSIYNGEPSENSTTSTDFMLKQFMTLKDQIILDEQQENTVIQSLKFDLLIRKLKRKTKSFIPYKRLIAYYQLATLMNIELKDFLLERLQKEKRENIKFVIVYSLIKIMDKDIFESTLKTISTGSQSYQQRVSTVFSNNYNLIHPFVDESLHDTQDNITLFLLRLSIRNGDKIFSQYIKKHIKNNVRDYVGAKHENLILQEIVRISLQYILTYHSTFLIKETLFKESNNKMIVRFVVEAYAKNLTSTSLLELLNFLESIEFDDYHTKTLSKMIHQEPELLIYIINNYTQFTKDITKQYLASIFEIKIDYILLKTNEEQTHNIILDILKYGYTSSVIEFLNQNKVVSLQHSILKSIQPLILSNAAIELDFRTYLKEDILAELDLTRYIAPITKKSIPKKEVSKIIWIFSILAFTVLLFPLLFAIRNNFDFQGLTVSLFLSKYVIDINYFLILYYILANGFYVLLGLLSFYGARKQLKLWNIKPESLLFEENLLPSISILAPAYNEELSIIESLSSLLNVKYPDYEIIVINDGSSDKTLETVIEHFKLKRKNAVVSKHLKTKAIRGIYTNKDYPNLILVDKVNGGKADALNVGINTSTKEYVCGIDADSVLEADALLRLSAVTLDEQYPILAFGGNIVPANGCVIHRGKIEKRGFPTENLPRLQSLEYMRAFTTGRVGWSQLNSLLIISGAFGLFQRQSIVNIGGYITSSGILQKDSVGEDMELVVRLTYRALENKEKYYVKYIFHANCYTELPSDGKTLLRQRNRWQRGLVDILSYYRKLLLNPKYKQIGLLAIPYFYAFEVMGPFIEIIGYTMLIIGLVLGILQIEILLSIFIVSILFGIIISLSSLYISDLDHNSYSKKEVVLLILYAFIENLGYRQLLSFHRAYSIFTALKESGKWGEQKRKGLASKAE